MLRQARLRIANLKGWPAIAAKLEHFSSVLEIEIPGLDFPDINSEELQGAQESERYSIKQFSTSFLTMMRRSNSSDSSLSSSSLKSSTSLSSVDSNDGLYSGDKDYVMVIGGCGYIGSHTALELLKDG